MPFYINRNWENQLADWFASMQAWGNARPINLGGISGPGGGYGGPPGGFIGQLSQSNVAYDTTESATFGLPASGVSLLHNLNRIRYRLLVLEGGGGSGISGSGVGGIAIQNYSIPVGSNITILNFEGLTAVNNGGGKVTVSNNRQTILTFTSTLSVKDNPLRIYNKFGSTQTISQVFLSVGTIPTGSGIIVDVHKNGTTIFTNQSHRPVIASGNYTGYTTNIDVPSWTDGEYLTAHVDQVGSPTPGSDLVVHIIHN